MTSGATSGGRVQVDQDRCEGNARCVASAPDVFELRDDDLSYVILDPVPAGQLDAVERAIRLCPRQAIAWVD
jgi:ferredoxin